MFAVNTAARLVPPSDLPTALVVDDDRSSRLVLGGLLARSGYRVLEAEDGVQAVESFLALRPDIVFMDVVMPRMDGLEATQRIKALSGEDFVPVVFISALSEQRVMDCIEAGGDDVLSKPLSHAVLEAKLQAMERIRDLHRRVRGLYIRAQRDQEIAEQVFSGAVLAGNVALDAIRARLQPADIFSGDVLLTAHAPSRELHVLLGDFTGHGLAAAIGALPAAETFRSMTAKGFSGPQILTAIDRKLHRLLPTGMFLSALFISIREDLSWASMCNCGMPDALVLGPGGVVKQRVSSGGLPLGIAPDPDMQGLFQQVPVDPGDRILLASDGLTEAHDRLGRRFGDARLVQAIAGTAAHESPFDAVNRALDAFCAGLTQEDDISLVEIPCTAEILPRKDRDWRPSGRGTPIVMDDEPPEDAGRDALWNFTLTLRGARLRSADPVPLVMGQIQEMEGIESHRQALFTVVTELYVNALDHGVLGLASAMKRSPEGFMRYFQERAERLAMLEEGEVRISVWGQPRSWGGRLCIQVEDSGAGFDFERLAAAPAHGVAFHGRGIALVRTLCESVRYYTPGNRVEVVYAWSTEGSQ